MGTLQSMNRRRLHIVAYLLLAAGVFFAAVVASTARDTARELSQARYEDQQTFNLRIESIDTRQDALGCTLESLQRRRPDLFEGAEGPVENGACERVRKRSSGNVEPSLQKP